MTAILSFASLLSLAAAAFAAQASGPVTLLAPASFPDGLAGWQSRGPAEFAVDAGETHAGLRAARITIKPGDTLDPYQQVWRDFEAREGDEMEATVWVRATEATDGTGAYMAIDFIGADDVRVGIIHSRFGAGTGRAGWEKLTASSTAPRGTAKARLSLVLHSHATAWFAGPEMVRTGRLQPWPDLGGAVRSVTIHGDRVVQPDFGGVGFHAFHHYFDTPTDELDQVTYKRWRELNPSFVRINDHMSWDQAAVDRVAEHLRRMKETGTQVYVTTWDPPDVRGAEALAAYARKVADRLEYWIRRKGLTNIRYYCMTNELSLDGWGKLANDLPRFREYQQALYDEFQRRKLPVGLLATDASPVEFWPTIEWAAQNMDGITAVYGGHHYVSNFAPDDERFYPWWVRQTQHIVGVAHGKGKQFILGEFGSKQDGRTVDGVKLDVCVWFGTPQEPMLGLQVPEIAIGAINAGAWAMGYWTFMDVPDEFVRGYLNKWGLFKCSGTDRGTRPFYYAYGLMTRFFRGPAKVYEVTADDPRLRVAALAHADGSWSIAVVNRNRRAVPLRIRLAGTTAKVGVPSAFRRYVYDPAHVPQDPFGDLQPPSGKLAPAGGVLSDTVGPETLTVYTTAYRETPPAAVRGLRALRQASLSVRLEWQARPQAEVCYYRIFRDGVRIGSTVASTFTDRTPGQAYTVVAVDFSGNAGKAAAARP